MAEDERVGSDRESVVGGLRIACLYGAEARPLLDDLAHLRITIFRDFPYLYEGDRANESRYLGAYFDDPNAIVVCAWDGDKLVGAATGAPMSGQHGDWAAPLSERGFDLASVFYCGESLLLGDYRGRGVGHAFFDHREAQARRLGASISCFCSVVRGEDHPARPAGYRPLDDFWRKRGYAPEPGLLAHFSWREVGAAAETRQALQFWMRRLEPAS